MNARILTLTLLAALLMTACQTKTKEEAKVEEYPLSTNPAEFLQTEDQMKTIKTLANVCDGKLYKIEYQSDYKLTEILAHGASSAKELTMLLYSNLLKTPVQDSDAGLDHGCSAFCVTSPDGDVLCGRNFDYRFVSSANVLVQNTPIDNKSYKSLGIAALPFLSTDIFVAGSLSDDTTDISPVITAPYICMDGVNENGLFICVLSLKGGGAVQHDSTKTATVPSLVIREILDHATTVQEAINIFKSHNFFADGEDSPTSDHFLIADASGKSVVIEYTHPDENSDWVMNVLDENHVTNFYLSKGWESIGVGQNRYEIIDSTLNEKNNIMTEAECMDLLQVVRQLLNPEELTSNTQWSAVYNLTKRTVTICMDKDYTRQYHFAIK